MLAHAELFSFLMMFGPGLGSAMLLLGLLVRIGRDLFSHGHI